MSHNGYIKLDTLIWKRPDAEAPIRDKRVITISSPSEKLYQLDFQVEMEMLMDVSIQKTNHSLFSARIAEDLTVKQGGVMMNSKGQMGEKETFGSRAAWLGFYGQRKTGFEGIVIMQHPSSRWFPSPWFTRDYGFMSPTPMYWPEDGAQTFLKKGEVVRLKYRVLIFGGTPDEAGIQALYDAYAAEGE